MGNYSDYQARQTAKKKDTSIRKTAETPAEYAIKSGISSSDLKKSGSSSETIAQVKAVEGLARMQDAISSILNPTKENISKVVNSKTMGSYATGTASSLKLVQSGKLDLGKTKEQEKNKQINVPDTVKKTLLAGGNPAIGGAYLGADLIKGLFGALPGVNVNIPSSNDNASLFGGLLDSVRNIGQSAYEKLTEPVSKTQEAAKQTATIVQIIGVAVIGFVVWSVLKGKGGKK